MKNRIGIVGGGQLGRMLIFEAKKLGFFVTVIDPTPHSPAGQVADKQIVADYKDAKAIAQLGEESDFITFEVELADDQALDALIKKGKIVNPSPTTLGIIKDKLRQKTFLQKAHIPVAPFVEVTTKQDILHVIEQFKYPIVLKARFDAYDGRGNFLIKKSSDIDKGLTKLSGRKLYVEKFVPFINELAVVIARSKNGEIAIYPVVETMHKNNICHLVLAPAPIANEIEKKAKQMAKKVMKQLKGTGVFGIEMFLTKDKKVYINEIAPRVHNSGHFTMEACVTSQFEQHIRAITGLPLGKTDMLTPAAVMINILGERSGIADVTGLDKVLAIPYIFVHIYQKGETKPERKMGHITVLGETLTSCLRFAKKARRSLTI